MPGKERQAVRQKPIDIKVSPLSGAGTLVSGILRFSLGRLSLALGLSVPGTAVTAAGLFSALLRRRSCVVLGRARGSGDLPALLLRGRGALASGLGGTGGALCMLAPAGCALLSGGRLSSGGFIKLNLNKLSYLDNWLWS